MRLTKFQKDGVTIDHCIQDTPLTIEVTGPGLNTSRIEIYTNRRKGNFVFSKSIIDLTLEQAFVFKHYIKSIEKPLSLWVARPRSMSDIDECELTQADFNELLNWNVLSDVDRERLEDYRDAKFAAKTEGYAVADSTCIYLMLDDITRQIKIGRSSSPNYREKTLLAQTPSVRLLCYWSNKSPKDEKSWHEKFKDKRGRGEWFALTPEDVKHIIETMGYNEITIVCDEGLKMAIETSQED